MEKLFLISRSNPNYVFHFGYQAWIYHLASDFCDSFVLNTGWWGWIGGIIVLQASNP